MKGIRFAIVFTAVMGLAGLAGLNGRQAWAADKEGFTAIFDGKTLTGWNGNPKFWKVSNGAITGQTTKQNPTKGNTFIIWSGGQTADFELKLEYRIIGGNSGVQYRSFKLPGKNDGWRIGGYQADFEAGNTYSGILYGERFRGILANRGLKTELVRADGKFQVKTIARLGDSKAIQAKIKKEDWNEYHIVARGFRFIHRINGVVTSECLDSDAKMRRASGLLALQLHAGPPMTVQFRNIRLKDLSKKVGQSTIVLPSAAVVADRVALEAGGLTSEVVRAALGLPEDVRGAFADSPSRSRDLPATTGAGGVVRDVRNTRARGLRFLATPFRSLVRAVSPSPQKKKVALIAGRKSHGYGAHEHRAGCLLLARALNASGLPVEATVYANGFPKDPRVLDGAATIVVYADGGGRHPLNAHIDEFRKRMRQGVGLVCVHYGVEVPKGKSGDAFLDWTGGYFEANWSVNPHWTARYKTFPRHPIARGVKPFSIRDEWYYHMRFRPQMEGVTPILTDLPPGETLKRPDGPHSGNKFVRQAIAEKRSQHMAWARVRPDGGRGFGFTGGHNHWNWGHDQFRRLVLNAIAWTAKLEVPRKGVPSKSLTVGDLEANQDFPKPGNHNPLRIQRLLKEWNGSAAK